MTEMPSREKYLRDLNREQSDAKKIAGGNEGAYLF
jgi:hypothetical protein